jgi:hypothetical protein
MGGKGWPSHCLGYLTSLCSDLSCMDWDVWWRCCGRQWDEQRWCGVVLRAAWVRAVWRFCSMSAGSLRSCRSLIHGEQQPGPSPVRPRSPGMCVRVTIRVLDSTLMLHERADVVGPRWPQNATAPVTRSGRLSRVCLAVCLSRCAITYRIVVTVPSRASFPSALPSVSLFGFHSSMCAFSVKRYL